MLNKKLTVYQIKDIPLNSLVDMYRQGYRLDTLQIEVPVNICQKAGQTGWGACDALGGICENTNCPGECSSVPTSECGCVATCSGVLPSQVPAQQPSSTLPPSTLPPVSVPPPSSQCSIDQWNIPIIGCQSKYRVLLTSGAVVIAIFLLTRRGEV